MKSSIKVLLVVGVVVLGAYFLLHQSAENQSSVSTVTSLSSSSSSSASSEEIDSSEPPPVEQRFSNAAAAYDAVVKAAKDGDDMLIAQFREPGPGCTWCADFYKQIVERLHSKEGTAQERGYLGAILALSGNAAQVQELVELYKSASTDEEKEVLAQALELSAGGADVVKVLEPLTRESDNQLEDSSLMALTAFKSQVAAEALYRYAAERDDADGGYSRGIGLAELVPDDEALPYIQSLAQKRDKFSPLAVKALLNNGPTGLRIVFNLLESSKSSDADTSTLIADAIDHVVIDDQVIEIARAAEASSSNAVAKKFAQDILDRSVQPQTEMPLTTGTEDEVAE